MSYIDYEMTHDDPARIQNIFERALQENCLNPELWLKYAKYLVSFLKSDIYFWTLKFKHCVNTCNIFEFLQSKKIKYFMYKTMKCAYLQIKFNILVGRYIHLELTDLIKVIIGHYLMHLQGAIKELLFRQIEWYRLIAMCCTFKIFY